MTTRPLPALAVDLAIAALLAIILPGAVLGHSELETIEPADGSVAGPPTEIVATFSQQLEPGRSSLRLVDASGKLVAEGGSVDADLTTMRLPLTAPVGAGAYTVRWSSFSAEDQEADKGTTTFTVAIATPPETAPPTAFPSAEASASAGAPASAAPASLAPTVVPAPSPSARPTTPVASTSDALIPIVVVVLAIIGLGLWRFRGASRRAA